ncbi:hypothetical protein L249_6694 [Ophiocordyceps polyrhachis-furcata BCC 54312]|uniref:NFACT RNA-binding domain-containing protein n=1 Tax=Ophiocordyceps polyrhachis-furcata BCC 54312 TaxID=1330021 RepID=A0A367LLE3_9HYPO|nr:hypothetical protein L249_6694 [Ophiocordyceps polyrhachis-furcata BCC 54312]
MVYYFTSNVVDPHATIYVGKDKFESWHLALPPPHHTSRSRLTAMLRRGPDQVWLGPRCLVGAQNRLPHLFHVDKLSSAHVYLRMQDGQTWDTIDESLIADLAQLTKANSIEGTHPSSIHFLYTPWSNLKKTDAMEVGQVSYKDPREVKRVLVVHRENAIVNRLNKTKVEKKPDLQRERDDRLKELRRRDQEEQNQRRKEEARQAQEWKEKKWQKDHAYDDMFTEDNMAASSNQDRGADWEDDFM